MPARGPCPKCSGQFVEVERSGVKIDACRECRGVFLDRGELDELIKLEQRAVANVYEDDESFFREMTGQAGHGASGHAGHSGHGAQGGHQSKHHHQSYGFDAKTAQRLLGDFRSHQSSHKKKHKKSLLGELFD